MKKRPGLAHLKNTVRIVNLIDKIYLIMQSVVHGKNIEKYFSHLATLHNLLRKVLW